MGNNGARSAGPTGSRVPGCSTGGGGAGRSGMMLYQWVGSSDSSSRILGGFGHQPLLDLTSDGFYCNRNGTRSTWTIPPSARSAGMVQHVERR